MTLRAGSRLLEWVPRLRRYARALVRHPQDADDLVQDTLERAWTKSGHWSGVRDMRAWLFSLMHNVHVDNLRRPSPDTVDISDEAMLSVAVNPSHDAALHIRDLEWALSQLPVEQREVLLLVTLEDMSYTDVARTLHIPVGTVMSRLSRGRERLRYLMDEQPAQRPAIRVVK